MNREKRLEAAVLVGIAMRKAQDVYFKTRTREALLLAKSLERDFDRLAHDALNGAKEDAGPLLL
jgi:hypothetical protein